MLSPVTLGETTNKALDAEPPIASFVKSMLICGGPVNAVVNTDTARDQRVYPIALINVA